MASMSADRNIDEYDETYWLQVVQDDPEPAGTGLSLLRSDPNDPVARWARARAKAQYARATRVRCGFGHCTVLWDPVAREDLGGFGPVGCPCESLPGAGKRFLDQRPKPRMAVKAVGRNGSRVQRSRRRHAGIGRSGLMEWAERL
jgi:hypothetical protein